MELNKKHTRFVRVPDINETNHFVVDAVEDKEKNKENTMHIPENSNIAEIPQNRAMMPCPLRKPNVRYPEVRPDTGRKRSYY